MHRLRKILVGVDLTSASAAALREASRLAQRDGAELYVAHVVERLVVSYLRDALGKSGDELERRAAAGAREFFSPHLDLDELPEGVGVEVIFGDGPERLVSWADELGVDLIVVGAWGDETGRGAGTFATGVLRRARCNVLLVDPNRVRGPVGSVVAATDLTDAGDLAIPEAVRFAAADRAQLAAVHVFKGPWNQIGGVVFEDEPSPAFKREYAGLLQASVGELLEPWRADLEGLRTWSDAVESRRPGEAIVHYAETHAADLLVMGAHRPGGLRYALLGSMKERVLRNLSCSLLSVRKDTT